MNKRENLRSLFREWLNDYLTVQQFADDHNMTHARAHRVINLGRRLHNNRADRLSGTKYLVAWMPH